MPFSKPRTSRAVVALAMSASAVLGVATQTGSSSSAATRTTLDVDLSTVSLTTLQHLLATRKLSSTELTESYVDRIRQLNSRGPSLNAVRVLNPEAVEEAKASDRLLKKGSPRGPLEGVPVLLKDNIDVRGLPTTAGNVALVDSFPADDAPLVKELPGRAVILGKTNLSEFANFMTQGAELVPVLISTTGQPPSILGYEFKRDLNAYLDRLPANAPMKSMQDVYDYNAAHADVALKFGQAQFVESLAFEVSPGTPDTVKYEADKAAGIDWARSRIDGALTRGTSDTADDLAAIAYAGSGSAGLGARAQYPSIVVPAGYTATHRRPAGLSLLGTAFSEARLIGLAYDFEQASKAWKPPAVVNPSLFRCAQERAAGCAP